MRLYVGTTDFDWYRQLSADRAEEANFWRPGTTGFQALSAGELFLFKLKSPHHRIVGGGHFLRYLRMPLSLAWRTYETANGVGDVFDFQARIKKLLPARASELDPEIGCVLLAECFWFGYDEAIEVPESWRPNIVQGRGYNLSEPEGQRLWQHVTERLTGHTASAVVEPTAAYGDPFAARARLGQAGFRALVTESYSRRCAITGERTLPALEAAHIQPYSVAQKHELRNGLLLRADLHRLFDEGLVTVTDRHIVEVSGSIKERWENGREYYALHGRQLEVLPSEPYARPAADLLRWHNENRFVG